MGADGRVFEPSITLAEPRRNILRIYDREMALVDSLPVPDLPPFNPKDPPGAFYWEVPGGRAMGYITVPFYPQGEQLIDPSGAVWSTERGDASYRIKRWAPGGDTALVVETRRALVAVTAAERDAAIASVRETLRKYGIGDQEWSKIPRAKPAVTSIFLADEGRLWVEAPSPDSLRRYDVYERDGRYAGTAVAPLHVYRRVRPIVRGDRLSGARFRLCAHLVFVTRYRRKILRPDHSPLLERVYRSVCRENKSVLVEFNGEADHVQLLEDHPPSTRLSDLVRRLKSISSLRLRRRCRDLRARKSPWSPSYFVASCGGALTTVLRRYIEAQERPL